MLAVINKIVGLVPPLVWAGASAMFLAMFLSNSWKLDSANKALGAAKAAVVRAAEVNTHNGETIALMQTVNDECIAGRKADQAQFDAADLDWQVEKQTLQATAQEVRTHEIEVYRDPTCADLAQMDVATSCPALAERLRVRTDSLDRIRNGGSASASAHPGT